MTHTQTMLAIASLFLVTGAIDAARADDRRVTLYTAPLRGDTFNCNAVNVSQKTLYVGLAILDDNGDPLTCTGASYPSPPRTRPRRFLFFPAPRSRSTPSPWRPRMSEMGIAG